MQDDVRILDMLEDEALRTRNTPLCDAKAAASASARTVIAELEATVAKLSTSFDGGTAGAYAKPNVYEHLIAQHRRTLAALRGLLT